MATASSASSHKNNPFQQQQHHPQHHIHHAVDNHNNASTASLPLLDSSANASFVNANESAGSLLDPMLKQQPQLQQNQLQYHNIHPLFAQQQQLQQQQHQHQSQSNSPSRASSSRSGGSASASAVAAVAGASSTPSPEDLARLPGQKPKKSVAPIRIPRRSEGNPYSHSHSQDILRSPNGSNSAAAIAAHGLSSAALTDSFPLPPPRTPGTPSQSGTFGSMSASGHTHRDSAASSSSYSAASASASASAASSGDHRSGRNSIAHPAVTRGASTAPTTAGLPASSASSTQLTSKSVPMQVPLSPRPQLPAPPPTPLLAASRAPSSLGGNYWDGEQSSVRDTNDGHDYDDGQFSIHQQQQQQRNNNDDDSHRGSRRRSRTRSHAESHTQEGEYIEGPPLSATRSHMLPYYSPDPAAHTFTPFQEDPPSNRIKSFAAELSTPFTSLPASPAYPPRTYSPAGHSDFGGAGAGAGGGASGGSRSRMQSMQASPSRFGSNSVQANMSAGPGRGTADMPPSPSADELVEERNMWARRRDSAGTFGTIFSSAPSIGMTQAINTLEYEDFDSVGTRTTSHTRAQSEVSIASSPGMTHELVRRGNVFESRPASSSAFNDNNPRRLARASLVSSQMLRSPNSVDALKSALLDDPAYKVDKEEDPSPSRPPTRLRYSNRYSSGPAPTLASLAEDDDDPYLPPVSLDHASSMRKSRSRNGSKRPTSHASRRNSNWGNKSSRSVTSQRSGQSSAHFTVASHAPSLPTLHKPGKRAEIATEEATLPFKKLARRASTLGEILDNKPEQDQYISYPSMDGVRDASYDDLEELKYSNQLRKARRKVGMGIPSLWGSQTPPMQNITLPSPPPPAQTMQAASEMREIFENERPYHVHPAAEIDSLHFRRRRSYPASQLDSVISSRSMQTEKAESSALHGRSSFSSSASSLSIGELADTPIKSLSFWKTMPPQKKRKVKLAAILLVGLVVAIAIGAAIPLSKHSSKDGSACERDCSAHGKAIEDGDRCSCTCDEGFSGPYCELDATCVCPDGSATCAHPLAKSILSSANYASTLFAPAINATRLATLLASDSGACAHQTGYIETPNLDPSQYKSRRRWIQAALLWDTAMSEDLSSRFLWDFQRSLSYWQWQDSPSFQAQPTFQTIAHGYTFDFALQKIFVPPKSLSDLHVNGDIAQRLDNDTSTALQRVGAFATAAATQRAPALAAMFEKLGYTSDQLSAFVSAIQAAPAVFPFDVSTSIASQSVLSIATSQADSGRGFPVPASCLPGLQEDDLDAINAVEGSLFGLSAVTSLSTIRLDCLNRPLYGFLDVLNLRSPFLRSDRPGQAVVVASQAGKSRLSLIAGALLTPLAYSGAVNVTRATTASFGTLEQVHNVLFDWLSPLPQDSVTKALIDYIISGSRDPPGPSSQLYTQTNALQALPDLEVQLWGGTLFSDVDYVVSSIALPSGSSLFGTSLGSDLRKWAHRAGMSKTIRWAASGTSSQYALDTSSSGAFQSAWDASGTSSPSDIIARLSDAGLLTS